MYIYIFVYIHIFQIIYSFSLFLVPLQVKTRSNPKFAAPLVQFLLYIMIFRMQDNM